MGTYAELMNADNEFASLIKAHVKEAKAKESDDEAEESQDESDVKGKGKADKRKSK